jgi:3-carboxy-cis,cis-muconate cycloisomerase
MYDLCRRCVQEDKPLLDLLLEDEKVKESQLTKDELARLCDPANYLGLSVEMVESVLRGEGKLDYSASSTKAAPLQSPSL